MRAVPLLACLALLLPGCAGEAPAAAEVVAHAEGGARFEPAEVEVRVNGTVSFRVESGRHTVDFESRQGVSNNRSGELSRILPYAVLFTEPGTYRYSCSIHPGMAGTVVVR